MTRRRMSPVPIIVAILMVLSTPLLDSPGTAHESASRFDTLSQSNQSACTFTLSPSTINSTLVEIYGRLLQSTSNQDLLTAGSSVATTLSSDEVATAEIFQVLCPSVAFSDAISE
jgi:hypothetical protein